MCFAPRYMNGPMAAPLMLSTKVASLSETPWARASAGSSRAASAASRVRARVRDRLFDAIGLVTGIAGIVQRLARGEHALLVVRRGRLFRDEARVDHVLRVLPPGVGVPGPLPCRHLEEFAPF